MVWRLAATLITLLPAVTQAQTYTETQMVNTIIKRPDGLGFFSPVGNPSLEGSNLVFFSQNSSNVVDSLWVQNTDTGAFVKLADTKTLAPGGSGNFSGFSYGPKDQLEPELRNGTVVFYGVDSANVLGLYTVPVTGGTVSLIARTGMACPSGGTFSVLSVQSFDENYSIDSGKVLINAQCGAGPGIGLYAANIDGTGLATVINPGLMITDSARKITYGGWLNAPLSNGSTAILGNNGTDASRGPNAIYAATLTGGAQTSAPVVDDTLPLPGDANSMPHWEIGQYELSGTQIAFTGSDSFSGSSTPAYYAIFLGGNVPGGGTISKIADINTVLPGIVPKPPLMAFTRLAFASGTLAFGAYGSDNVANVYIVNGGNFVRVAHASLSTTDLPGGFYTYNLWPLNRYAVSNGRVAFRVSNQVDDAIMLATPVSTSVITAVTNAASYTATSVAPGEIVTVFGSNLAPAGPGPGGVTTFTLDATNHVPSLLAGTRLLINGIPAPLLYVSPTQLSAIVPYELLTTQPAQAYFVVENQGAFSAGFSLPVTTEAPGLFSINAMGTGAGAILNQNGTVNSASNAASAGDTISLFGTGDGEEDPIPATGSVISAVAPFPSSLHFAGVTIGGVRAQVTYRGAAPGAVAGLFQINATIPAGLAAGNQPVIAQYDNSPTQTALTVAVK
jgi:uncharacterized protein (TIGR03437 family)